MSEANSDLTERELEILRLLATGATNHQIARALVISPNTVKVHLRNIFGKMGVESRTEATMRAVQRGLVAVETPHSLTPPAAPTPPVQAPLPERRAFSIGRHATPGQRALLVLGILAAVAGALLLPGRALPHADLSNPFMDRGADSAAAPESGTKRWSVRASLPTARGRLAVVAYKDRLYAIGGVSGGRVVDVVEEYRPDADAWSTRAPRPLAAANIGAAVAGDRIYVPGGYTADGQVTAAVHAYDPVADRWSTVAPLPQPVCAYAIAAVAGMIYVLGGWNGQQYTRNVWRYDPASDRWQEEQPIPVGSGRGFAAAAVVAGKVYVIGGYDGSEQATVLEYDPGTGTWADRAPLSAPRAGMAAVAVGSSIYVVGGGWHTYLGYSERLDLRTSTWSRFETPILGQWRNLGAAVVGDRLYAVGGWSNEDLDANREYQTVFRIMLPRP